MRELNLTNEKPLLTGKKRCKHCMKILPKTEFNYSSINPDHLQSWCKKCHQQYVCKKDTNGERNLMFSDSVTDRVLHGYSSTELINELKRRGYDIDI